MSFDDWSGGKDFSDNPTDAWYWEGTDQLRKQKMTDIQQRPGFNGPSDAEIMTLNQKFMAGGQLTPHEQAVLNWLREEGIEGPSSITSHIPPYNANGPRAGNYEWEDRIPPSGPVGYGTQDVGNNQNNDYSPRELAPFEYGYAAPANDAYGLRGPMQDERLSTMGDVHMGMEAYSQHPGNGPGTHAESPGRGDAEQLLQSLIESLTAHVQRGGVVPPRIQGMLDSVTGGGWNNNVHGVEHEDTPQYQTIMGYREPNIPPNSKSLPNSPLQGMRGGDVMNTIDSLIKSMP